MKPNYLFCKQILFCFSTAIILSFSIYYFKIFESKIVYTLLLLAFYMPAPLYAVLLFDRRYLHRKVYITDVSCKSLLNSITFVTIIFLLIIGLNFFYVFVSSILFSETKFGFISFDNTIVMNNLQKFLLVNISEYKPKNDNALPLLFTLIAISTIVGIFINSLFAFTEEIGWRGSFFENLVLVNKKIKILVIGILWGMWHSPLVLLMGYNFPESPYWGAIVMIMLCISMSYLFHKLNTKNIVPSSLLHGCINASPVIYILFQNNFHDIFSMTCGIPLILSITTLYLLLPFFLKINILLRPILKASTSPEDKSK